MQVAGRYHAEIQQQGQSGQAVQGGQRVKGQVDAEERHLGSIIRRNREERHAARHVGPKLNGKNLTSMKALKKAVSADDYKRFVEIYSAAMKKQGLRNYKGGTDFLPSSNDPLHMELADPRLPKNLIGLLLIENGYYSFTKRHILAFTSRLLNRALS